MLSWETIQGRQATTAANLLTSPRRSARINMNTPAASFTNDDTRKHNWLSLAPSCPALVDRLINTYRATSIPLLEDLLRAGLLNGWQHAPILFPQLLQSGHHQTVFWMLQHMAHLREVDLVQLLNHYLPLSQSPLDPSTLNDLIPADHPFKEDLLLTLILSKPLHETIMKRS